MQKGLSGRLKHLMWQLCDFNNEITGLPIPKNLPRVLFVSQKELNDIVGAKGNTGTVIFGLYRPNDKTIFLNKTSTLDDVDSRGALAHELVHYMQDLACVDWTSVEADAYKSQTAYMELHGVNPVDWGYSPEHIATMIGRER